MFTNDARGAALRVEANRAAPLEGLGEAVHKAPCMLKAVYDFSVLGGVLGNTQLVDDAGNLAFLPPGAIVTKVWANVVTTVHSADVVNTPAVKASLVVQDLTYTAKTAGLAGDSITIAYTAGGTSGAETVSVTGTAIVVHMEDGVSTATSIRAKVLASAAAMLLIDVAVSGTGSTAQDAAVATPLANGADAILDVDTGTLGVKLLADSDMFVATAASGLLSSAPFLAGVPDDTVGAFVGPVAAAPLKGKALLAQVAIAALTAGKVQFFVHYVIQ